MDKELVLRETLLLVRVLKITPIIDDREPLDLITGYLY